MGLLDLLNTEVTIQRATVSKTAAAESKRTWVTIGTARAAIQQARGRKLQSDAGQILAAQWLAFLPAETDIRVSDRLLEGGRTYEILLVENLRGHHLEAQLRVVNV